ncbi:MAG: dienelactone hydrolase family protein, partial [Candidatus Eisenbacteria bacterium]|nr:dienelactone hydrolase family protein [Candidatus Eisenbacteria bacterium]
MTDPRPQGFLAVPPDGEGSGVLVLHAWWGLNDTMKRLCSRLADSGFVAFAPDLYHGEGADTIERATMLGRALDAREREAMAEVAAAVRYLEGLSPAAGHPGLAVIGFSLGTYYALALAASEPERIRSVVLYYGTGGVDPSRSRAAYLGHFAENDPYEPASNVDELEESLRKAGRPVTFHRYAGTGHWFCEPDRADAYDEPAAALAWERTLEF